MHLLVNTAFAIGNSEIAVVTPGLVPAVCGDPVVSTPSDDLNGVSAQGPAVSMTVDSTLVVDKVFIDGESSSDRTVFLNVLFDVVLASQSIRGCGFVFVVIVFDRVVFACFLAFGSNLFDFSTIFIRGIFDMMRAEGHGVRVTGSLVAEVAASDHTLFLEPFPGRSDLTAVAAHALALQKSTASSGVSGTEEGLEIAFGLNAETVVEGFGGTVGPAGSTVGLVSNVADHVLAFGPGFTGIEAFGHRNQEVFSGFLDGLVKSPSWVHYGAHEFLGLFEGHAGEFGLRLGGPGGFSHVDDSNQLIVVDFGIFDKTVLAEAGTVGFIVGEQVSGQFVLGVEILTLEGIGGLIRLA